MSQTDVYNILKELGGKASSSDIKKIAKEKFPNRTLYMYVGNRLRKLERKKVIEIITMPGPEFFWKIIDYEYVTEENKI